MNGGGRRTLPQRTLTLGGPVCLQLRLQEEGGRSGLGPDEQGWKEKTSSMDSKFGGPVCLQLQRQEDGRRSCMGPYERVGRRTLTQWTQTLGFQCFSSFRDKRRVSDQAWGQMNGGKRRTLPPWTPTLGSSLTLASETRGGWQAGLVIRRTGLEEEHYLKGLKLWGVHFVSIFENKRRAADQTWDQMNKFGRRKLPVLNPDSDQPRWREGATDI